MVSASAIATRATTRPSWAPWGLPQNISGHGFAAPREGDDVDTSGLNLLTGHLRRHHPVMLAVPLRAYPLEWDNIVELNGLRVPARFDCNNFNEGRPWTPGHDYFSSVPSRWFACNIHEASIKSGMPVVVPQRPLFDEEYIEHVAVLQSVLRAPRHSVFTMAEVGARWGPWGARAAAFARAVRPDLRHQLHFVEPGMHACQGIQAIADLNGLVSTIECARATAGSFINWVQKQQTIDLVDIDIQGHEQHFVPEVAAALAENTYRVIVGTHGTMGNEAGVPRNADKSVNKMTYCHEKVKRAFSDWILVHEIEARGYYRCIVRYIRGNHLFPTSRFEWRTMYKHGCYHNTSFGPIAAWDGELIYDNPKFVNRSRVFSLADTELKIDELLPHATRRSRRSLA